MKKLFKVFFILILLCAFVYAFDIYSGFKISTAVDSIINQNTVEETESTEDAEKSDNNISLDKIMYNSLDDNRQAMYDTIYKALSNHRGIAYLKNSQSSNEAFEIVKIVVGDHPELFYYSGECSYSGGVLEFNYDYTKQEAELLQQKINAVVDEITPYLMEGKSDYEKSLRAFEWIVSNRTYDSENLDKVGEIPSISTIEGVFIDKKAVCGGYARAYQYLLKKIGIPSVFVSGDATTGDVTDRHAWICQELGGEYYFSDPTWCDAYEKQLDKDFISHTYFCINSTQLEKSHKLDEQYEFIKTNANKYNYFHHEKLEFSNYSSADIRGVVKQSIVNECNGIELCFTDDEAFKTAKERLIDEYEIYYILKSIDLLSMRIDTNNISYSLNEKQKVIMIAYKYKY